MRLTHNLDYVTPEMIRETRLRYYGQVSHIDYQLGRLFGELKTLGLYDNTAIVFTADHGEHLGDHGVFGKTTYLNSSAQVPLIVRPPQSMSGISRAHMVEGPVITADICPTLMALAGLSSGREMDGRSLLPVLAGGGGDQDRMIFGECGGHTFATDGRFKYLHYCKGGAEQLFDSRHDPDDLTDLADDPQHAEVLAELRSRLIDYLASLDRPAVKDGHLVVTPADDDAEHLRSRNPFAWRGPMRYGRGYTG
jgi:arylsulfatase